MLETKEKDALIAKLTKDIERCYMLASELVAQASAKAGGVQCWQAESIGKQIMEAAEAGNPWR